MKRKNKMLCMLLASAMVVTSCSMPTYAAEAVMEVEQENFSVEETLKESGTATVSEEILDNSKDAKMEDFEYKENDGNITITKYNGSENELVLADIFPEKKIVAIGTAAFSRNNYLTKIVLPETVATIGNQAFLGCNSLGEVVFDGNEADEVSPVLQSIGDGAFQENSNLLKITLPETVNSIGQNAFRDCSSLAKVEFAGEAPALQSIGEGAFQDCTSISKLTLPEHVTTIGKCAFLGCEVLTRVEFGGENPELQAIGISAFQNCKSLTSFSFPDNLQTISETAFKETALKDIVLPENLELIGSRAFYQCGELRTVEVKSLDVSINENAFESCKSSCVFIGEENSTVKAFAENKFIFNRYTDSISINSLPTKTEYFQGEELNTEGLRIFADYTSDTEPATGVLAAETCTYSGYDKSKVGTQTVTVKYAGKTATFDVTVYYNLEKATIDNISSKDYTGKPIKPDLTITGKETQVKLVEGKDYEVELENNINAGVATVKIVGIGQYRGEVSKEFTINKRYITAKEITATVPSVIYNGLEQKPIPVIKDGDITLTEKDYTIKSYSDNVKAGTGRVYIEAKGNYQNYYGSQYLEFTIEPRNINEAIAKDIPEQIYTGKQIEPGVVVEENGHNILREGTDYMVQYSNNTAIGTARVLITGIGNYKGTIEKTFTIKAKNLADVTISGISEQTYNGTEIKPVLTVYDQAYNIYLNEGTDYTVSYSNNKNIGTAGVTVTGIGNYTGTVSVSFRIQAKKGTKYTVGAYVYKVTSTNEVAFAGLKKSSTKKVTILSEVNIGGKKFKVTSIANNALKGKAVTSVTVGKNVKTIGYSAFENCSKLKKITIKGTLLKKVGKKAFKGINAKAVIKVPKKKLAAYKKLMKNKGQSSTVKIK